jgi:hypothetical protein
MGVFLDFGLVVVRTVTRRRMSELTIGRHYAKTRRTVSHSSGVCKFEIQRPGEECPPSERPFNLAMPQNRAALVRGTA